MDFNNTSTAEITRKDIDFVADNKSGKIWILHGKPFKRQDQLAGLEFDIGSRTVTILARDGTRQHINVPVQAPLNTQFAAAQEITVIWTETGKILDMVVLPIISVHNA